MTNDRRGLDRSIRGWCGGGQAAEPLQLPERCAAWWTFVCSQGARYSAGVRILARASTSCTAILVLASCSQTASPDPSGAGMLSSASSPTGIRTVYRPALATSIPAPDQWSVDEYQGTAVTAESPPGFIPHGPRITFERLGGIAPAVAFRDRCGGAQSSAAEGPTSIAGHHDGYQYLCSARTFIGPEWTVLLSGNSGLDTWRVTYLGAAAVGQGSLSQAFVEVLSAFEPH